MAIDIMGEALISLHEATRLLPARRRGKKPHVSCLYRWTTAGCRGVILESVCVGGTRCTSREALARFIERLSSPNAPPLADKPQIARHRELQKIEEELDGEGIT
jgi:hypothetical protein